jgi:hypothetical protein
MEWAYFLVLILALLAVAGACLLAVRRLLASR